MKLDKLADNFGVLLDAPTGVTQLRRLIKRLALRGGLVAEDPAENPYRKKAKDTSSATIKGRADAIARQLDELVHELPPRWTPIKLSEVVKVKCGYAFPSSFFNKEGRGLPLVRIRDIARGFTQTFYDGEYDPNYLISPGACLIGMDGNFEVYQWNGEPGLLNQRVCCLSNFEEGVNPQFIILLLSEWLAVINQKTEYVTVKHLSARTILSLLLRLPPPEEQDRIVAKVDQLMLLCDQLEQKRDQVVKARGRFNAASLEKLVTARDPDEFDECWGKVRENFNLHFQSPESIPAFKEALLALAVQGRLAPQNSADESAHDAESKLEAFRESERQPKSGTVAKSDLPISEHELPFPIPSNWAWVRLGTLAELITKGSSPRWQGVRYVDPSKEDGLLFITSTNVLSFELDLADPSYVEPRFNEIEPRSILRRGDFLMNLVGASIGRTAIYDRDDIANINQAVCLIRPLACCGIFDPRYLLTFFNSPACIRYMFDKQVDMARANLSMTNVARFLVPLPPLPEQVRIVHKIKQISNALTAMSHQFTKKLSYENRLAKAMSMSALQPNDRLIRPTESDQSTRISAHEVYTCS